MENLHCKPFRDFLQIQGDIFEAWGLMYTEQFLKKSVNELNLPSSLDKWFIQDWQEANFKVVDNVQILFSPGCLQPFSGTYLKSKRGSSIWVYLCYVNTHMGVGFTWLARCALATQIKHCSSKHVYCNWSGTGAVNMWIPLFLANHQLCIEVSSSWIFIMLTITWDKLLCGTINSK